MIGRRLYSRRVLYRLKLAFMRSVSATPVVPRALNPRDASNSSSLTSTNVSLLRSALATSRITGPQGYLRLGTEMIAGGLDAAKAYLTPDNGGAPGIAHPTPPIFETMRKQAPSSRRVIQCNYQPLGTEISSTRLATTSPVRWML